MTEAVKLVVRIEPKEGVDPDDLADTVLDVLCSVGENTEALAKFDAAVFSVDSCEVVR